MKSAIYWSIRNRILNLIFYIKKVSLKINSKWQLSKEYKSFRSILFARFISGAIKGFILALLLGIIDRIFLKFSLTTIIESNLLGDVILGELGVAGVILGLYCSNISSVYSTRYANAPEKIAIAFQYDRLTVKSLDVISSFIIYGTIILVELLLDCKVSWATVSVLIIWSILVVIYFGITGNRIYQLSDVFRLSDDAHLYLERVISKNLKHKIYVSDNNYQAYFRKITSNRIELLKIIQKYGCNPDIADNSSVFNFMCKNLGLINQYWSTKQDLPKDSLWFRKKSKYQQWHLADSIEVLVALDTGTPLRTKEEADFHWFENELMAINKTCVNYLIIEKDFETLYSYLVVLDKICQSAIKYKEASYYLEHIDWINNIIQNSIEIQNNEQNISFIAVIEYISVLYLNIILESRDYFKTLDIDKISKSVIDGIDTGKSYNSIKTIRGRRDIDIFKKILLEVNVEKQRITPVWLIKQYVAKEEFDYVNLIYDVVKEGIEHIYFLSNIFIEKKMYYEACILISKFYKYESELTIFLEFAKQLELKLFSCHIDSEDSWEESGLDGLKEKFRKIKQDIPEMYKKCSSTFTVKNWDREGEFPDFLGECFHHISRDTIEAIVNSDKKQFKKNFEIITQIMPLYQEHIRLYFNKNKNLYSEEYNYYMITCPIVEWAQLGGLGIIWGEFFKDKEWSEIVKESSEIIFQNNNEENSKEFAIQYTKHVKLRNQLRLMCFMNSRDLIEDKWNDYVVNAIKNTANIETENTMFGTKIKTDSKLIKVFCPSILDDGFRTNPSELFWVICVNPLVPEEKRFNSSFSWEKKLND